VLIIRNLLTASVNKTQHGEG